MLEREFDVNADELLERGQVGQVRFGRQEILNIRVRLVFPSLFEALDQRFINEMQGFVAQSNTNFLDALSRQLSDVAKRSHLLHSIIHKS